MGVMVAVKIVGGWENGEDDDDDDEGWRKESGRVVKRMPADTGVDVSILKRKKK